MFFAAVAVPRPEHGFDGCVTFYLIGHESTAHNASKTCPRGARTWVSVEVDKKKTIEMMKQTTLDALKKTGQWAKSYKFQMDNAGGHGGGRCSVENTTCQELNEWAAGLTPEFLAHYGCNPNELPTFEYIAQPPKYPDLNVLGPRGVVFASIGC